MKILNVFLWVVSLPVRLITTALIIVIALGMVDWSDEFERDEVKDTILTMLIGNLKTL
jgi:hypothetical protein